MHYDGVCLFSWVSAASHGCTTARLAYCTARFGRSNFGHQMPPPTVHLGIFFMPQICNMGPTPLLPFRRKAC
jgi:hypothetical protein